MKKTIFLGALCLMNVVLFAQGYELRILTFEDKDAKFEPYTLDYVDYGTGKEITTWSDLIDDPQYGGPLTYADFMNAEYHWYDENNTELAHTFPNNYAYCFWGGGHAISNYWGAGWTDEDRDKHIAKYYGEDYVTENAGNDQMLGWFNIQMMIPVKPHSGENFAVHYGYKDFFSYVENLPEISFADGEKRVIDHMYVTNTNYTLNQLYNGVKSEAGNSFGGNWEGLTDNAWMKIVAYGFDDVDADKDTEPMDSVEFYLVQGENVVTDWQKWDLSPLGEVAKVRFNFLYSDEMGGRYGFTIPGYFAYDDVAVRFPLENYTRNGLEDGKYGTICLPCASATTTGATFYEVSYLEVGKGLWLDELKEGTQLEAGKPYIFKANASEITVTYTGEAKTTPVAGTNGLTGTFTYIAANTDLVNNYIIADNNVWIANTGNTLPANRAYIKATEVPTTAQAQLPGRRRVCMGENAATSLDNITNGGNSIIKVVEKGQLIIIRGGVKYNVQGVRL